MRADDAVAVAALIRTAFAAIPVPLDPAPSAAAITGADVLAQLEPGGGAVWDTEKDGDGLAGCVLWRPQGDGLYLGRLAVAPGRQGRGIGRTLLTWVEREARRSGRARLLLEVRLALVDNRRLFAACGFAETALCAHPGHAAPTFARMEKRL